ncbi:hypothetical protein J6590_000548 [Homalodisca vitripennis]|nr:hypothetical protein J6590_000548 [Homalodisca vitripennis]
MQVSRVYLCLCLSTDVTSRLTTDAVYFCLCAHCAVAAPLSGSGVALSGSRSVDFTRLVSSPYTLLTYTRALSLGSLPLLLHQFAGMFDSYLYCSYTCVIIYSIYVYLWMSVFFHNLLISV